MVTDDRGDLDLDLEVGFRLIIISIILELVCRNAVKYGLSIKHNALEG